MIELRDISVAKHPSTTPDEAISAVVQKHIDFVYGVARRKVGDGHLAEDVTQAVFILMMRKARHITNEAAMASWLYQATLYCAANAQRMMRRRDFHERQAAAHRSEVAFQSGPNESDESQLHQLLDQAIDTLSRTDRAIILMHYFGRKTHKEVAAATGSSEDAVRKRANRAVDRMRAFFSSRGATVSTGAVIAALSIDISAPASLVDSASKAAILSQWGQGPTIAMELAGSTFMTQFTLSKVAVILLMLTGSIGIVLAQVNPTTPAKPPAPPVVSSNNTAPTVAPAPDDTAIKMDWAMPELLVPDIDTGVRFYRDKLGFKVDHELGKIYAIVSRDGARLGLYPPGETRPSHPSSCVIYTKNVDKFHDELLERDVKIQSPIQDQFYGLRDFQILDPGGNRITFAQEIPPK